MKEKISKACVQSVFVAVETKISILFWREILRGRSLQFTVTIFFLLIGQKAKNLGCYWFVELSDNSILLSDTSVK